MPKKSSKKRDESDTVVALDDNLMAIEMEDSDDPCFRDSKKIKKSLELNKMDTRNIAAEIENLTLKTKEGDIHVKKGLLLCKQTKEEDTPFRAEFVQIDRKKELTKVDEEE